MSLGPAGLEAPGAPVHAAPPADAWTIRRPARVVRLGRLGYDDALALQLDLHARRVAGLVPDTILLLEHDSVYTAGRAADPEHFLVPPDELVRLGHGVRETQRGGDVTWHGPGQVVAYPIFDLSDGRRDVHRYLRLLEDVLIRVAATFGAEAARRDGLTGAWCAGGKIGAIGIRVARWVTLHGTAFNVAPDMTRFDAIVPCGIRGASPTSLLRETGLAPSMDDAMDAHAEAFARVFSLEIGA